MVENLNHRNPLELKENISYYVKAGTVHIFLVKQSDQSDLLNKRNYLDSAEQGMTICGGKAVALDGYYQLIAIGSGDALLEEVEAKDNEPKMQWDLQRLTKEIELETMIKAQQYIYKKQKDAALLNKAVNILLDNEKSELSSLTGDIYYRACQIAAKAMKQTIEEPQSFSGDQQPFAIMMEYFHRTNLKYRQIKLKGSWWKSTEGIIIAFKDNKQPVVLLPTNKGRYEIADIEQEKSILLNDQTVGVLLKDAFLLYRALPEKELNGKDLLGFALKKIMKKDIILFMLSLIGIGLLGMLTPILIGLTVDWIIPQGDINLLFQAGIILAVVAVTTFLFNLARGYIMLRVEGQLDVELQSAIWNRLINLPLSFFKQFSSAELASRALGITMIRDIVSGPVMAMLMTSIYSLFSWLVLFYYNAPLAIITSLMIGLCIVANYYFAKRELFYESRINQLTNQLTGFSFQLIKGAIKIQQSGTLERAYYKWGKEQAEKHKAMKEKGIVVSRTEAFNGLFLPVSMGIIFYLITMHPAFSLPVGHFIGFNSAYMIFVTAIFSIFSSLHVLFQVLPLYNRGKIILQAKPECNTENTGILMKLTGRIEVNHVQFRYTDEGPDILKDISLQIKSGEYVGIVGTSGSGKSTLMRLLLGFQSSYKGKITYDDQDINSLNIRDLRKKMGVVLQTGKLMTDSIYHNIIGTNLQLTLEDAWKAAKIAGIDEDIRAMPMGMHTFVMDGAGTISGGQKQRILIARAVVNQPKILLFDEATSALDNITQARIKQSLDQLTVTRIVIAHRLSTVKDCDRIIVLDQGLVKETGSFEELINKQGIFYAMAKRQLV